MKKFLARGEGKLCIFAHHKSVLNAIEKGCLKNVRHIRIDGSTGPKIRQEYINQFQQNNRVRVALLGITAAGVAVTLTAAKHIMFAELFWTPAILLQAEDRCHRIGQTGTVRCKYFIATNTIDDLLWELTKQKFRVLGEIIEGKKGMKIKALGGSPGKDAKKKRSLRRMIVVDDEEEEGEEHDDEVGDDDENEDEEDEGMLLED